MRVIAAGLREVGKKADIRQLRKAGRIPGVLYGPKVEHRTIWVDEEELIQYVRRHGYHGLFRISLDGGEPLLVMMKEVQQDPLNQERILHVDLYHVVDDQPVETVLPLEFAGEPAGVKQGGVMQIQTDEVEVRGLPRDLPPRLTVSVSHLEIGDHLFVRDLTLPAGLELLSDPDELVLTILEVRKDEGLEAESETAEKAAQE